MFLGCGGTNSVNLWEELQRGLWRFEFWILDPGFARRTSENRSSCATASFADSPMASPMRIRTAVTGSRVTWAAEKACMSDRNGSSGLSCSRKCTARRTNDDAGRAWPMAMLAVSTNQSRGQAESRPTGGVHTMLVRRKSVTSTWPSTNCRSMSTTRPATASAIRSPSVGACRSRSVPQSRNTNPVRPSVGRKRVPEP